MSYRIGRPSQASARRVAAVPTGWHSAVALPLPSPARFDLSNSQLAIHRSFTRRSDDIRLAGTAFALKVSRSRA
jgi:hypothetical protein